MIHDQLTLTPEIGQDSKLEEGIVTMASLNRNHPAAWVMLGMVFLRKKDLNLAANAFERALELDSPQAVLLRPKIDRIREHIKESRVAFGDHMDS